MLEALQRQWPWYARLMRLDRPIGIYLLLWPTLWALWMASDGQPNPLNLVVFVLGVILMRSAGCVINDFADRNIDGHVTRTRNRPLALGKVSPQEALILFSVLVSCAFLLVCLTNQETVLLSIGGLILATLYPFTKRFVMYPQVFLGAAFAWAVPMAFMAETLSLPTSCWLLYLATLVWTVAYDTQYAMVDREDDLRIGVKSMAILLGDMDNTAILMLQMTFLAIMWLTGIQEGLGLWFNLSLCCCLLWFARQHYLTRGRVPADCFRAFLNNHWVGATLFAGLFLDMLVL